jgi:dienelactone hydrolase
VIDLDYALRYVKTVPEYADLDVVLFGHSWGAYSSGSVLKYHPDVKAVVMVAGMNRSEDMLAYQGRALVGDFVDLALPFVKVYEGLKFGQYASATAMDGFAASDAGVMILHSRDDRTVPACYGYDIFREGYGESDRFRFVLYEDRGHSNVYYTQQSMRYRSQLNQEYLSYVEERNAEHSAQIKDAFFGQFLDIRRAYELDRELMEEILGFFDAYTAE